ncbi:MAG TPA: pyruvate, phosphate dikinase [Thermoanaerobaculia bacterium]|nr:pyruvate, phosphate dikinase [Thermoanaerobaculia bacterium]
MIESPSKAVYFFEPGHAEGSGELKEVLGGKGAGLAEMSALGIPVPPGFTLTTEVCRWFQGHDGTYPEGLVGEVEEHLGRLEQRQGEGLGDAERPLLLSVRSGAPISMPGMMDTVLNLGLTRAIVESAHGERGRFLRDCYRRLLFMYGDVVLGVREDELRAPLREVLADSGAATEQELQSSHLDRWIAGLERVIEQATGESFPQDPKAQLWGAIGAVFRSWNNRRAVDYRRLHGIPDKTGTGVTVQVMVFGNRGRDCATGVAFSRDPATGERRLYGEYLTDAQGEDVVAGTHTPKPIQGRDGHRGLAADFPAAHAKLEEVCERLERHFRNMQDLEFTIQHGELYMLQTRVGKRSGPAAVRIAVDMVRERLIDRREALRRVEPQHLTQMMAPVFDREERRRAVADGRRLARGLAAGPGAASGRIAFTAERATEMARSGPVLLVRNETSPEDIVGMHASVGILTTRGGMTSHAAVVARGMGKPCVVGADELHVDDQAGELRVGDRVFGEGDELSIDGTRGEVLAGAIEARPSEIVETLLGAADGSGGERASSTAVTAFQAILRWADRERRLGVRANADTPQDARVTRVFGGEGIGLCRTEHMFFEEERIPLVRQMILAEDETERRAALARLLPLQQGDFEGIFEALAGMPVTVRLLDPPLHEFLPKEPAALERLARSTGKSLAAVRDAVEGLAETNPMLGLRGCRLGIVSPEIYEMQAEAIARAACAVLARGVEPRPEVMIPLTGVEAEMQRLRAVVEAVIRGVAEEQGLELEIPIGTMIEVPRAALLANRIALHSDFFSFGTNDLTQMTFGYSRDDAGRFLPVYLDEGVLPWDPFARLDEEGVGELVEMAARRGRMARPELKLGVCGEHGGDPFSIEFFERCQLDYVSCSPYRLPVARLAAARAHLAFGPGYRAEGLEGNGAVG